MDKGIIIIAIVCFCVGCGVWYFMIGGQMFEVWDIEDLTMERIDIDDGYKFVDIYSIKYSDDWWYVSIHTINIQNGTTCWNLLKYNSVEDRYVYDNLNHITIVNGT